MTLGGERPAYQRFSIKAGGGMPIGLGKCRWRALVLAVAVLSAVVPAGGAHAGVLTNVAWSVSKAHPGDTSTRGTWIATTATTAIEFIPPSAGREQQQRRHSRLTD